MRIFNLSSLPEIVKAARRKFHENYLSMYSSIFDGIVTDPVMMVIPFDDHVVHRGDGIFETLKCVNGNIYNMDAHLERLNTSAKSIGCKTRFELKEIVEIILETVKAGKCRDCLIRVLISRGPGSLGVNPYDCPETQLYVMVTKGKKPFMETHPSGATIKSTTVLGKQSFYAGIKSCNYLPNILMKKDAVDSGVDFVVGFDEKEFLTEGATENVGIVTHDGKLLFPKLSGILKGTTMIRVMELAETLVKSGNLSNVGFSHIDRIDMNKASEILLIGTTLNVTAAVMFNGEPVGKGVPGQIQGLLDNLLVNDIADNSTRQTKVF